MYYIVLYLLSEERLYFSVISCSFKELFSVHEKKKISSEKSNIFLNWHQHIFTWWLNFSALKIIFEGYEDVLNFVSVSKSTLCFL